MHFVHLNKVTSDGILLGNWETRADWNICQSLGMFSFRKPLKFIASHIIMQWSIGIS